MRMCRILTMLLAAFSYFASYAQAPISFPATNGTINTMVLSGNTLYVGGSFTQIGKSMPNGVQVDAATGTPDFSFVKPNGNVEAVVSDGSGGWYIGGTFDKVGSASRNRIARINADGTLHAWDPGISGGTGGVRTLYSDGSTLYVGGDFTTVAGQARTNLAAFNITSGTITSWAPSVTGGRVYTIAGDNAQIYVGGNFTSINGQTRTSIARFSKSNGTLDAAWAPNANGAVHSIALNGSTVYVGGLFTNIGTQNKRNLAALNTSGIATSWVANTNGGSAVNSIAVTDDYIYVGGTFTSITTTSLQTRNRVARFKVLDGTLDTWAPNINTSGSAVNSIAVTDDYIYVGGTFTAIGATIPTSQLRNRLAALNTSDGSVASWDPNASGEVKSIAVNGSDIYVAGTFTSIGMQTRNRLAAFDITTRTLKSWNPNASGPVNTLVVDGSTLYVGGDFTTIGGQNRNNIAALNTSDGLATAWDPNANGAVRTLAMAGSILYAGGDFTTIGGQNRNRIAALNTSNNNATAWNPDADGSVHTLAVNNSTVYAGGAFTGIGGQSKNYIAALNTSTAFAEMWNPNADAVVRTITINGSTLYVGGDFTNIGSAVRNRMASFNLSSGAVMSWNPNVNGSVFTSALSGNDLYIGGAFSTIGGSGSTIGSLQARGYTAAFDISTGLLKTWAPNASGAVNSIAVGTGAVYMGGSFSYVGGTEAENLAAIPPATISLPLKLTSFTGHLQKESALLSWHTSLEENTSHFEIEKSTDGKSYTKIGVVSAAGNSHSSKSYTYIDQQLQAKLNYYRLKMVDTDGTTTYSKVVIIRAETKARGLQVFPNPVYTDLQVQTALSGKLNITIYDAKGSVMQEVAVKGNGTITVLPIDVSGLQKGIFYIEVQGEDGVQTTTFLKK